MGDITDHVAANLYAKTAAEVALHDAWARCLDVPLYSLLGGLARDRVEVTWAVGAEPVDVVVDEIQRLLDSGQHRSFELKMGAVDPADDVERIASIADKMSSAASLRVDLNARWDVLTSLRFLPRLAEVGIDLIEQPVPGERVDALAEVNRALPIPVMADERCEREPRCDSRSSATGTNPGLSGHFRARPRHPIASGVKSCCSTFAWT